MKHGIKEKQEQEFQASLLPRIVNRIIMPFDYIIIKLGVWYKVLFLVLFPAVAVYFPISFLLNGVLTKYFPQIYPATRTITVFCITGLFIILATTLPRIATLVEILMCSLYVLVRGLGVSNFVFYQFNSYGHTVNNSVQRAGLVICSLLLLGKAVFFVYNLLRIYRRKHMRRRSIMGDYFDEKFYDEEEDVVYKGNDQKDNKDNNEGGFFAKKEKVVVKENLPDMSGFIISDEDFQ